MKKTILIALMMISMLSCWACSSNDDGEDNPAPNGDSDDTKVDGDDDSATGETDTDVEEVDPMAACKVDADAIDGGAEFTFNPESVELDVDLFPLGVQAGAMTINEALLWSNTINENDKVLLVWRDIPDINDKITLVKEMTLTPTDGGYLKEKIKDLAPGTVYRYAFFEGTKENPTARSMVGRFKTAIPEDCPAPLLVAGTHGTNRWVGLPFDAIEITSRYELDLALHLGDYSYNDDSDTLEGYRSEWHDTLINPKLQVGNASTGQYIVWDDHEIADNHFLHHDFPPEQLAIGKQAFFENTPVERRENDSYWKSFRWGKTAEFFSLDCRHERQPETRKTEDAVFIGKEQMVWLKDRLLNSPSHFKVVLTSVPITKFPPMHAMQGDRWEGYASQRDEILNYIAENEIKNVWWITGDFHLGCITRLEMDGGPREHMWEIMVGPGGNGPSPTWLMWISGLIDHDNIAPEDQFRFYGGEFMATMLTFDPAKDAVHVVFVDAETEEVVFDEWLKESD